MKFTLARLLYSLVLLLAMPLLVLHFLTFWCLKKPGYDRRRLHRFGLNLPHVKAGGLLFHCVSVGEVVCAEALIKNVQSAYPELPITISTTTSTGAQQVKERFADTAVQHCYLPYDLPFLMRYFLKRIQPKKLVITEVELWPNLIWACHRKNVQSYVINARMTDASARNYTRISALFTPLLQQLTLVCAQGQRDYDNYLKLGMIDKKLVLTNNMKFEQRLSGNESSYLAKQFDLHNRSLWLATSTHDPEESLAINAQQQLLQRYPDLLLVLVPRHPQRFDEVYRLCKQGGMPTQRLSMAESIKADTRILLVDEMGKLNDFYPLSVAAFVGGSIADRGGHNALEPAYFAKPIMMGGSRYNNPHICQTLTDAGALLLVEDTQQIVEQMKRWLTDKTQRERAGNAGKAVLNANKGALTATFNAIFR